MKLSVIVAAAVLIPAHAFSVPAADDPAVTRMALCRDSWIAWSKGDPRQFETFRNRITALFAPHGNDPFWLPKTKAGVSVLGFPVSQAFPQSVGMGVGFSLAVEAGFDDARKAAERALGRALDKCEAGEGMRSCELAIGPQRTFMLLADDRPKSRRVLIGCYYFYEK